MQDALPDGIDTSLVPRMLGVAVTGVP